MSVYLKLDEDNIPRPTLLGLVSWGKGCALKDFAGVYAKIASFEDWVIWAAERMFFQEYGSDVVMATITPTTTTTTTTTTTSTTTTSTIEPPQV